MSHNNPNTGTTLSASEIRFIFDQTAKDFSASIMPSPQLPIISDRMPKRIEHTLLKMDTTFNQIAQLCDEAIEHEFRGICCLPRHIAYSKSLLENTDTLVVSVVDFPLCGATTWDAAVLAQRAVSDGADEIDIVMDVSSLKSLRRIDAFERIALVVESCPSVPIKVILETACLNETEIAVACAISKIAGAAFVKTSTGFASRGASVRDIEIMKAAVGDTMRIKASGGIKSASFAQALVEAGADVIGTSAGPACIGL